MSEQVVCEDCGGTQDEVTDIITIPSGGVDVDLCTECILAREVEADAEWRHYQEEAGR